MRSSGADVLDFLGRFEKWVPSLAERMQSPKSHSVWHPFFSVQPSFLLRRLASKRPSVPTFLQHAFFDHFDANIL
jgi:hypothetical protein